jgi:hypothetical protein
VLALGDLDGQTLKQNADKRVEVVGVKNSEAILLNSASATYDYYLTTEQSVPVNLRMAFAGDRIQFSMTNGTQEKVIYDLKLDGGIETTNVNAVFVTGTQVVNTPLLGSNTPLLFNSYADRTYDFQVTDDYKYRMTCDGTTLHFELVNNDGVLVQKLYTLSATDGLNTTKAFTADDGSGKNKRTLSTSALTFETPSSVPCLNDFSLDYFTLNSGNKIQTKAPVPRYFYPSNNPGDVDVTDLIGMTLVTADPGQSGLELTLLFEDAVRKTPFGQHTTDSTFNNVQFQIWVEDSAGTTGTLDWWTDTPPQGVKVTYDLSPDDTEVVPHIILLKEENPRFTSAWDFKILSYGANCLY